MIRSQRDNHPTFEVNLLPFSTINLRVRIPRQDRGERTAIVDIDEDFIGKRVTWVSTTAECARPTRFARVFRVPKDQQRCLLPCSGEINCLFVYTTASYWSCNTSGANTTAKLGVCGVHNCWKWRPFNRSANLSSSSPDATRLWSQHDELPLPRPSNG